jgi:hypothetical protein
MATRSRAKRGNLSLSPETLARTRFLRPPYQFTVQLGLLSWHSMSVKVTSTERGGPVWSSYSIVELDLEGRIPPDLQATLGRALEDFITTEWTERISRSF